MMIIWSHSRAQREKSDLLFCAVAFTVLGALALLLSVIRTGPGAQPGQAATSPNLIESGKFRLYKLQQAVGEERYEITREADSLVLKATFELSFLGGKVPLAATLRARPDLTPVRFEIKGNTSTQSTIDTAVEIKDRAAAVREGKASREVAVPDRFFTVSGYAPVSVQMMLFRYWTSQKIKGGLQTLPGGEVTIERRGRDTVTVGGRPVELDRYSVGGVTWGRESLWLDSAGQLIALICGDAELDRFEAIREGYAAAMPIFVARGVEDGLADLARIAGRISPTHKGTFAIVGGLLIDGTGQAPIADSVVVIEGERITAAGPRSQVKLPKGAAVIDARGKAVLPGLWDMHAHFEQVEWAPATLAAGVTTVREAANEFELVTALRDAIKSGRAWPAHAPGRGG
jgi:hypothetical protein